MTTITWVTRGHPCTTTQGPTTRAHPEVSPLVVLRTVAIVLDLFKLMGLVSINLCFKMYRYLKTESLTVKLGKRGCIEF